MDTKETLFEKAIAIQKKAYAPYSNFFVGTCILTTQGHYFTGCNVENASYGLGICAEACAICNMVANGEKNIQEVAIVGSGHMACYPCGACRQRLLEFSTLDIRIHMGNIHGIQKTLTLGELLPYPFGPHNMESQ